MSDNLEVTLARAIASVLEGDLIEDTPLGLRGIERVETHGAVVLIVLDNGAKFEAHVVRSEGGSI